MSTSPAPEDLYDYVCSLSAEFYDSVRQLAAAGWAVVRRHFLSLNVLGAKQGLWAGTKTK